MDSVAVPTGARRAPRRATGGVRYVLGILLGTLLPPVPSLVARATALLPTGWLVGTQVHALGEFGIAFDLNG